MALRCPFLFVAGLVEHLLKFFCLVELAETSHI